jgi:transposase
MLGMDQVHVIRHKVLREGASIRRVARELGLSRNTVSKYLEQSEPRRRPYGPRGRPVWERVESRLEELLAEWEPRTTAKQRLTGVRLHRALLAEGHQVGLSTIYQHLRERRRQRAEVYVPLIHRAGDEAQVDFFEVTVELGDQRVKAWEFLMRLMYSGCEFAWLYERCDQLAFFDGHVRAFSYLGGVVKRCIYDNLTPAVRKIVGARRELNERFRALVSHYLFEPCFARIGEGHDKGGVESRGKAIRLRHLTPIPRGESLEAIARALLQELEQAFAARRDAAGRSASELWAEERARLMPRPAADFEVSRVVMVEISSRAMVLIEGAWYSVPSRWARLRATAYIGVDQVRIVCMGENVTHPRSRFGVRQVRYRHYLPELAKKPQAVRQVAPELIAELGAPWGGLWELLTKAHGEREAARVLARLLGAVCEHGEERVRRALEAAVAERRVGVLDLIASQPAPVSSITVPAALSDYVIEAGRAADYDHLLLAARGTHE